MRLKFKSEFDPADLPVVQASPADNAQLLAGIQAMPVSTRVHMAGEVVITDAVRTYYFAKTFRRDVLQLDHPDPLWTLLGTDLMRLAVINVAVVNDASARTKSLPNTLQAISEALAGSHEPDTHAAVELLADIKRETNPDTVLSLKYVQQVRNKWAGHASFDRHVDGQADAETSLSLPLVEDALVRLVNAYQDISEISGMSAEVRSAIALL